MTPLHQRQRCAGAGFEGYLATTPDAGGEEIAKWFWGETASGQLLRRVRDRLDASDDPKWKAAAFGVAR